jgi:CRP-like cAMP-binding protein
LSQHLIRKLSGFNQPAEHDQMVLAQASARRVRKLAAHATIIEEDQQPNAFYLVREGWVHGYKMLAPGRRQITAFFLPGDVCHFNQFVLRHMDHSIGAITPVVISEFTRESLKDLTARAPGLVQALWWESLVNSSIQREWTVNIAQRGALERVAHLICELFLRLENEGLTTGDSCEFPLTQVDIGDALGLTGIHVNRMLQQLRSLNLLILKDRALSIPDIRALRQLAGFNPNYLHLSQEALARYRLNGQ